MKKIYLFKDAQGIDVEQLLSSSPKVEVVVEDITSITDIESVNADLIVLAASDNAVSALLNKHRVHIPVLIASNAVIPGVESEFYDYILAPVKAEEFAVRVSSLLKIKQLQQTALTDDLTGLYNRQFIHRRLEEEMSRAKRYKTPLACLLFDIDFFKVINDMYGYETGDRLLKKIGEVLSAHARKEDIVGRYGDEEFILVLPNTPEENAYLVAERIRKDVATMEFIPEGEDESHTVTVSGGLSSYPFPVPDAEVPQTLVRYAEHALYNAKKKGKNKVIKFSQINIEF